MRVRLLVLSLLAMFQAVSFNTYSQATEENEAEEPAETKRPKPKAEIGEIMATTSGIGLDFYRPPFNGAATADGSWHNVNLLLYCLEMQVGWGRAEMDYRKLDPDKQGSALVGTPGVPVYGRNWAVGINLPIAAKSIGINSARPGALLRAHFFGAFSIGGMSLWDRDRQNKSSFAYFTVAPGFRVYNNLLTAEVRLLGQCGIGIGEYDEYLRNLSATPVLTVRANGLFNRLVRGQKLIGSTSYSISDVQSSSKTDYIDRADGRYERTTTTTSARVSSSRGTSLLNDIGRYIGVGPRVTFTRPFAEHYAEPTLLYGLGLQGRSSKFLYGLNVETGKAGHASITRNRGEEKRKIDASQTYAKGALSTTNVFADLGIDISSLAKGLFLFTADDDNNVTTFASLNFGYSVGYSLVSGQAFSDDSLSVMKLTELEQRRTDWESNKRTDPRESASGIVGGFFVGFDIGNVGFRAQWYRYKNAPLANNLCYTLTYRLISRRKK